MAAAARRARRKRRSITDRAVRPIEGARPIGALRNKARGRGLGKAEPSTSRSAMFLRPDLDELLACNQHPCVSLYLPTHPAGREVRQDAIRLRKLLSTAAKRLATGRRGGAVDELLEPARKLVDDQEFWRYQDRGLALFLAPGFDRVHKLPVEVDEALAIGQHFRIKPLLSLLDQAGPFRVLTVSAGRTRLYQGSHWTFAE